MNIFRAIWYVSGMVSPSSEILWWKRRYSLQEKSLKWKKLLSYITK